MPQGPSTRERDREKDGELASQISTGITGYCGFMGTPLSSYGVRSCKIGFERSKLRSQVCGTAETYFRDCNFRHTFPGHLLGKPLVAAAGASAGHFNYSSGLSFSTKTDFVIHRPSVTLMSAARAAVAGTPSQLISSSPDIERCDCAKHPMICWANGGRAQCDLSCGEIY
jgi:hypothetical protein